MMNCLIMASQKNDAYTEMLKCLTEYGGKIRQYDVDTAVNNGHIEIIKFLLEYSEYSDGVEDGAVGRAAISGQLEKAKFLLEHGGKIGDYDVSFAVESGHLEAVKFLVENGGEIGDNIVSLAAREGYIEIVKFLLERGGKIGDRDVSFAADSGHLEVVKFLVEKDGEIGAHTVEIAARNGHIEVVKFLVENGGNIGDDAVRLAAREGYIEIVKFLVHAQIAKCLANNGGNLEAALELAARSKNTDAVQYLLGMGLKSNIPLLGITNQYGDWSSNVFQAVTAVSENTIVLPLESRHVSDMNFMQKFSGFINPGAADTYPKIGEFSMADIDQKRMYSHETDYQNVLRFATAHKVPYIGICAGSQHLALNRNGSLHPVEGYSFDNHEVTFIPGSASHFFTLTPDEQRSALTHCQLPEVTIKNVNTAHSYAAVADKRGEEVSLGALSEEGVVQSLGLGLIHVGFQFHPEDHYSLSMEPLVNREKNIFNTFSKLVLYHHAQTHNPNNTGESLSMLESKIMERLAECAGKTMPLPLFYANDQCLAEEWEFTDILQGQYWQ